MGEWGGGLRGRKIWSVKQKAAGCVSLPPLSKSDRVRDTELWRCFQTVGRGGMKETAWQN